MKKCHPWSLHWAVIAVSILSFQPCLPYSRFSQMRLTMYKLFTELTLSQFPCLMDILPQNGKLCSLKPHGGWGSLSYPSGGCPGLCLRGPLSSHQWEGHWKDRRQSRRWRRVRKRGAGAERAASVFNKYISEGRTHSLLGQVFWSYVFFSRTLNACQQNDLHHYDFTLMEGFSFNTLNPGQFLLKQNSPVSSRGLIKGRLAALDWKVETKRWWAWQFLSVGVNREILSLPLIHWAGKLI